MVAGKKNPEKMVPGKTGPRKNGPRKIGPLTNGPGKLRKKIVGWASSIVVCVCGMLGFINLWKPETWQQTQDSETNNRGVSVEHRVCVCASVCVCVECSDVIDLWKPKTRQQTFLDSFSVLQFGACRIVKWTSNFFLYMQWNQSIKIKKSFKFPSILLTENNFWRTFFRGLFSAYPLTLREINTHHNYNTSTLFLMIKNLACRAAH